MRRAFLGFAAASLVAVLASCATQPAVAPKPGEAPASAAQAAAVGVEGVWNEVRNEEQPVTGKTWTLQGGKVVIHHGDVVYSGTYTTDDSREPKEIDFTFENYPTNQAVYSLSGDEFTFKVRESAAVRAKTLAREKGYTLIVCARAKDAPAAEKPAPDKPADGKPAAEAPAPAAPAVDMPALDMPAAPAK